MPVLFNNISNIRAYQQGEKIAQKGYDYGIEELQKWQQKRIKQTMFLNSAKLPPQ